MYTKSSFLLLLLFVLSCFINTSWAQSDMRVEPPFWWVGMKNPKLQLLIHDKDVGALKPKIEQPGITLKRVISVESPNYLFLDLEIEPEASAGTFSIDFYENDKKTKTYSYELKAREGAAANRHGFSPKDVMYLITPDRFVNGDPSNDEVAGMLEGKNRAFHGGRHGGDIAGIDQSLEYLKDMGFTAIWLNPVLENDQPAWSYHGYATTDYYQVDARYGTNEEYINLIKRAKSMGIGMIMDIIVNHCGSKHWWMDDLPTSDWVNNQADFEKDQTIKYTNHLKATIQDPYVAQVDLQDFTDGWFDSNMPDLNQRNPLMATYLIQNSIWWIEYADLLGIRMDTYPYPERDFMTAWTCAIMEEFPNFNIVGEEWHGNPAIVAHWQRGKVNPNGYTSCLPSLMDFPIQESLRKSLNTPEGGWNSSWKSVYETLANDFQYPDPFNLVVFPDNHDMSRIFTQVDENFDLYKLALTYILTMRGTPQLYYGTEILMKNPGTEDHGIIRSDFPGGWAGDTINGFTGAGLSAQEKEAQAFVKTILNWRKGSKAIHEGKLMHYAPKGGVYVFFRYTDTEKVMVILNKEEKAVELPTSKLHEAMNGEKMALDIISGKKIALDDGITVPAMSPMILELK
ncbi:MAG: glycoside hydrolase family 13 protein [Bacteroidota bacterium]